MECQETQCRNLDKQEKSKTAIGIVWKHIGQPRAQMKRSTGDVDASHPRTAKCTLSSMQRACRSAQKQIKMVPLATSAERLNRSKKRILVHTHGDAQIGFNNMHCNETAQHDSNTIADNSPKHVRNEACNTHAFILSPHTLCQHACTT